MLKELFEVVWKNRTTSNRICLFSSGFCEDSLLSNLLPSLAYLTGAVLLVAAAGYTVDAVYQRLYRLLRLPALETKLDALTARILQNIVGSKEV